IVTPVARRTANKSARRWTGGTGGMYRELNRTVAPCGSRNCASLIFLHPFSLTRRGGWGIHAPRRFGAGSPRCNRFPAPCLLQQGIPRRPASARIPAPCFPPTMGSPVPTRGCQALGHLGQSPSRFAQCPPPAVVYYIAKRHGVRRCRG